MQKPCCLCGSHYSKTSWTKVYWKTGDRESTVGKLPLSGDSRKWDVYICSLSLALPDSEIQMKFNVLCC